MYSPLFLFSLVGVALAWKKHGNPLVRYLSVSALVTILVYSKWATWWGGHAYGPRYLADLTPALALFLFPVKGLLARSRVIGVVFVLALAWSVTAHAIGVYWERGHWNICTDVDRFPGRVWSWSDSQILAMPRSALDRIRLRGLPTSRRAPGLVSASYRSDLAPALTVTDARPVEFSVAATNDGRAVWRARTRGAKGAVRLGWRWFKQGETGWQGEGRSLLCHDVAPHESASFRPSIRPPREPGVYVLEVGLVNERIAWLADAGVPPVRSTVSVRAARPGG
ncbi:MAG: hypothetical protein HY727_10685 [Candidatus Rokubacteria bacterium]|nr:hypothetical protein [Candidatus Rokubacteria bacterium]